MGTSHCTYELRFRAVQAVLNGLDVCEVAEAFGTHRSTIFRWLDRYDKETEEGLLRRRGSGRPRKLECLSERGLERLILKSASDFGYETALWTVARLQTVIHQKYHINISKDTVWRRLREAVSLIRNRNDSTTRSTNRLGCNGCASRCPGFAKPSRNTEQYSIFRMNRTSRSPHSWARHGRLVGKHPRSQ